jgi:alkylation response protein AidB-like acyl-CoA dehydrogenase
VRFALTPEQEAFADSLAALLSAADTAGVARAWAADDFGAGLELWKRLADQGVNALAVPEESGGLGASAVELVIAFEALGRYAVPGPWVESAAYLPRVLTGEPVERLAAGAVGTVVVPPHVPYALDADVADQVYAVRTGALHGASRGDRRHSVDGTRRLFAATPTGDPLESERAFDRAFHLAVLATSAQLLGLGEHLLAASIGYARQRRQFGREIGSYQAIKHRLADVRIALDFARPLVFGAALADGTPDGARDASAAKVAAGDAAYLASRVGLQVHGAIGYTRELDLSLWVTKVRALVGAWGTPAYHRTRVLDALVAGA